jgi:hypothetical protein
MPRLSQFDSAKLIEGGRVRVEGPTGGYEPDPAERIPVHFAIVRDGHVLTGVGAWGAGWRWSGETDDGVPGLTPGPSYVWALEVRFAWDEGGELESAGGYGTYCWSQEIELEKAAREGGPAERASSTLDG